MMAERQDQIFLEPGSPRPLDVESASSPDHVAHVHCEGAHWHVLSWSLQSSRAGKPATGVTHCSEPRCIINRREATDD